MDPNLTYPIVINATLNQPAKPFLESLSTIGSVFISIIALAFGLYNFWWANLNRGKIIVSDPLIYAIKLDNPPERNPFSKFKPAIIPEGEQGLQFRVPLIFLNTGGATRFIQDIKITLQKGENKSNELNFVGCSTSMDFNTRDSDTTLKQFAIEGHKAYSTVFIFYRKPGNFVPSGGNWEAELKAKLDNKDWQKLHKFGFYINPEYLLYDGQYEIGPNFCDDRSKIEFDEKNQKK